MKPSDHPSTFLYTNTLQNPRQEVAICEIAKHQIFIALGEHILTFCPEYRSASHGVRWKVANHSDSSISVNIQAKLGA